MSNKPVCPTRVRSICHEGNAREERAHFGVSSASVDMTSTAVGPSWSWTPSLSSILSKSSSNSVSSDQHSSSASPKKKVPLINFWFPRRLCIADFSIVLAQHKGEGRKKAFHQLAPTISKSNETAIDGTRLYNFFFPFFFGPVQGHTNWTYFPYRFSVLSPLCQTARTTVDMRVNHWEMGKQRITKRGATERR